MDSSSLQQTPDLSKLSDRDKQELQQFIVNETQKARIQQCMFFSFLFLSSFSVTPGVCFRGVVFIWGKFRGNGELGIGNCIILHCHVEASSPPRKTKDYLQTWDYLQT